MYLLAIIQVLYISLKLLALYQINEFHFLKAKYSEEINKHQKVRMHVFIWSFILKLAELIGIYIVGGATVTYFYRSKWAIISNSTGST